MRRHKMGLRLRLFPFRYSALALSGKNPYKIKLRTSKTPKNNRYLSKPEKLSSNLLLL
jgi:hypothetical protein